MDLADPVALARALVRAPSVTPDPGEAIGLVAGWLEELGAECSWVREDTSVPNLVARLGGTGSALAFACHTDVVPPGDLDRWRYDPFAGVIEGGRLWGRGACDMKGALACAIAAAARTAGQRKGTLWFYVTGDEEGASIHGTAAIVRWLQANDLGFDGCIVTEPTSQRAVGDTLKIGRRGSLNARLIVEGRQGHTAFPDQADNPIHRLTRIATDLTAAPLDAGTDRFEPSTLQISTFDVGNPATNVIPAQASLALNIRFNTEHTPETLEAWVTEVAARHAPAGSVRLDITSASDAFLGGEPGFTRHVADAVVESVGRAPQASTSGGTSDARFLKDLGPVVELGTIGHSLHQIDEWVGLDELEELTRIFTTVIERFQGRA